MVAASSTSFLLISAEFVAFSKDEDAEEEDKDNCCFCCCSVEHPLSMQHMQAGSAAAAGAVLLLSLSIKDTASAAAAAEVDGRSLWRDFSATVLAAELLLLNSREVVVCRFERLTTAADAVVLRLMVII